MYESSVIIFNHKMYEAVSSIPDLTNVCIEMMDLNNGEENLYSALL